MSKKQLREHKWIYPYDFHYTTLGSRFLDITDMIEQCEKCNLLRFQKSYTKSRYTYGEGKWETFMIIKDEMATEVKDILLFKRKKYEHCNVRQMKNVVGDDE